MTNTKDEQRIDMIHKINEFIKLNNIIELERYKEYLINDINREIFYCSHRNKND